MACRRMSRCTTPHRSVSEAVHIQPVPVVDVATPGTGSALASCHDRLGPILLLRCFPFPKRYLMRPVRIESSRRKRLPDEPRCLPGLVWGRGGRLVKIAHAGSRASTNGLPERPVYGFRIAGSESCAPGHEAPYARRLCSSGRSSISAVSSASIELPVPVRPLAVLTCFGSLNARKRKSNDAAEPIWGALIRRIGRSRFVFLLMRRRLAPFPTHR